MSAIRIAILGEALDPKRMIRSVLIQAGFAIQSFDHTEVTFFDIGKVPPDVIVAIVAESCTPIVHLIESLNVTFGRVAPACIVLSQSNSEESCSELYDAGAREVFAWPVTPTLLVTKVRLLLKCENESRNCSFRSEGPPFGRYAPLREIARGKMGVVYSAIDSETQRLVALKTINEADSIPLSRLRLEREIQLLQRLRHPRIVSLLDSGSNAREFYYAMDFVEGPTLRHFQEIQGRLHLHFIAAILFQLADALHYIHSQGVIHRDIKPSNIFFCRRRGPILGDFGLSRATDDLGMTPTNVVLGTVAYMSPEVLEGSPPTIHSDLFSLGLVALDMLNGAPLFPRSSTFNVMQAIVNGKFPDPASLIPSDIDIDQGVLDAIRSLLHKHPDHRPRSAEELKERLKTKASVCWDQPFQFFSKSQQTALEKAKKANHLTADPSDPPLSLKKSECFQFQKFDV